MEPRPNKILLHSCCSTCSGSVIEKLHKTGVDLTVFFYNPNIQPKDEYEKRKAENKQYAKLFGIPFIDADYNDATWWEATNGHEEDEERGERCSLCFEMRLKKTAEYAHQNGFAFFSSVAGISRWKDFDQVTQAGLRAASLFPGLTYWTENWRKENGSERNREIAKEQNFYQQQYCGCLPSLKKTNERRLAKGQDSLG